MWYTVSNFLTKSIGFITTPIFTRLLTHAEFGDFSNYTSWLSIFMIFVSLNLESTFISARYDYEKEFDEYILSTLVLSSISTAIWFFVLNINPQKVVGFLGMEREYIICMMVYLLFIPAINMFQTREVYYFRYKMSVLISMIISVGTAVVSVLLVIGMENRLDGRVFGSALPTILLGIIIYIYLIKRGKRVKVSYWKYALPICLPFIPHLLSMTVLNSMDRIMIKSMCGSEDTALYSLAYTCGTIITVLITSLNTAFAPWLGEKLHEEKHEEIRSFSKKYILVFMVMAIGIMLISPEVLLILGGKSYLAAIYVMPPVACGCMCQFLYTMFVNVEQFKKKTIGMAFASVSAAVLNYLLNLLFIPRFGYVAAAYTTLAGFLWLLIIHMLLVRRIGLREVYDNSFVFKAVGISIVATAGITFLYQVNWIRYIIIAAYILVVLYFFKKYIKPLMKALGIKK